MGEWGDLKKTVEMAFRSNVHPGMNPEEVDSAEKAIINAVSEAVTNNYRSISEVQGIVDAVRQGIPVQIDYYNPETDDNPYVVRAQW